MDSRQSGETIDAKASLLRLIIDRVSEVVDFDYIQTYPREDNPNNEQRGTSFQVLIQIIISLRATLEKERLAATQLFAEYRTPQDMIEAPPERIAELIRPAGMHMKKAETIIGISREVLSRYQGDIDQLKELPPEEIRCELLSLHGVGPKAADCMLELGFGIPYLPVDVNVDRVSRRLGMAPVTASKEEVRIALESLLPKNIEIYIDVHTYLLALGKYYCRSKPLCFRCPVVDLCPYTEKRLTEDNEQTALF